jgi:phospholipid/cholesterol/gamma-HCH transport system substrate-binding protein
MSREVKIGILALVAILGSVWGYSFLKGRNLLTNSYSFYAKFENIEQMPISAPVLVSGYQVGTVSSIVLDPSDMKTVIVEMDVEKNFNIPSNTVATLVSLGLMGQKGISLKMSGPCSGADCAKSGDYFKSRVVGMMEGMLGENAMSDVFKGVGDGIGSAFDTINQRLTDPNNDGKLTSILNNIDDLSAALIETSKNLNGLIYSTNKNLGGLATNMNAVVTNLENNNSAIEAILKNAAGVTGQLNDSDIKGAVSNLNNTLTSADKAMGSLDKTLKGLDNTLANFQKISADINSGKGTMGKLIKDQALYDNLTRTSANLDFLLQDFRLNPKRYVNVSVFGKKQKEYEVPEEDPAFQED